MMVDLLTVAEVLGIGAISWGLIVAMFYGLARVGFTIDRILSGLAILAVIVAVDLLAGVVVSCSIGPLFGLRICAQ